MAAKLTKQHLDAGLVTRDPDSAHRFYHEVLGFPVAGEFTIPHVGLIRRYSVGASTLRVYVPEQSPARDGSRDGMASQTGIRYLTLTIANLEETVAAVAAAGFKITLPVRDLRPGVKVAHVEDADGNTVELMQEV